MNLFMRIGMEIQKLYPIVIKQACYEYFKIAGKPKGKLNYKIGKKTKRVIQRFKSLVLLREKYYFSIGKYYSLYK